MANVTVAERISAPAEKVWDLVGRFDSIHKWLPGVKALTMPNASTRKLAMTAGGEITEQLLGQHPNQRSYTYSIIDGAPLKNHVSTLMVVEEGPEASTVSWVCTFAPVGAPEEEVRVMLRDIYKGGLAALQKKFKK